MSSQKRSWIKMNIATIVLVLLASYEWVETRGVIKTELKSKINTEQARTIIKEEIKDRAFSKDEGIKLKTEYEHINKELLEIKNMLLVISNSELSNKSRTQANKKHEFMDQIPFMAIIPDKTPSGDENILIKELEEFHLTK